MVMVLSEANNNVNLLVLVIVVQNVNMLRFVEMEFNKPARLAMMEIKLKMINVPIIAH